MPRFFERYSHGCGIQLEPQGGGDRRMLTLYTEYNTGFFNTATELAEFRLNSEHGGKIHVTQRRKTALGKIPALRVRWRREKKEGTETHETIEDTVFAVGNEQLEVV